MSYIKEWQDEENDLFPDDWTEEDKAWWNNFVPVLREALFESTMREIKRIEARIAETPDIEPSDDFKIKMNKLFRDNLGADCKVPHPEVELKTSVNS